MFFPLLFVVFAMISFGAVCLLMSHLAGLVAAFFSGLVIAWAGADGKQTLSVFLMPLAGILTGITMAVASPPLFVPTVSWEKWLVLIAGGTVLYVVGHIIGLLTLRFSRSS